MPKAMTMNGNQLPKEESAIRQVSENEVQPPTDKYQALFNHLQQGFCIIEMLFDEADQPIDYRFLEINPMFEKQTGLQQVVGKTMRELAPHHEEHWFRIYGEIANTRQAVHFENQASQLAGGVWYEVYAFPTGPQAANQVAILFTNITARKQAEEALRQSEARFRLMADVVPQVVWITDPAGVNEFFNKHWFTYTGAPYEPTNAGRVADSYVHPEDAAVTMEAFERASKTGSTFTVEHRIRSAAGEYRWFLVRAELYRDPATGQILRWFGVSIDIHDRKIAEAALQQLSEELTTVNTQLRSINVDLDNFVYTASHDLRAPVNNLEGLQAMLFKRISTKLDEKEQTLWQHMSKVTGQLKGTLEDLSSIAKLQQELGKPSESVSFPEMFEEVTSDLASLISQSDAQLETDWQVETVTFPRPHLRSILYNLLSNALKYRAHRRPRLEIATGREAERVWLSVRDNGMGIPRDQFERVFAVFKRIHTHVEGSGVGLFMVKRMVENHGGSITFQSQVGVGTIFTVYFRA